MYFGEVGRRLALRRTLGPAPAGWGEAPPQASHHEPGIELRGRGWETVSRGHESRGASSIVLPGFGYRPNGGLKFAGARW